MKIILLIFLSLASIAPPALSHGSKDDCSSECNDYYCPPEMKKNNEKSVSKTK
tara:strand:- start:127 stop:285 length:159 start_codon:yes stop_codon:yes gene_type:complete